MRWLTERVWRLVARIAARPAVADWLIVRAQRTPYFHLPGYMDRWWLFNAYPANRGMPDAERGKAKTISWLPSVRIHHILREDRAAHAHDHPWNARTIILRGDYTESRLIGRTALLEAWQRIKREPGNTARLRFGEFHHIERVSEGGVWTLFITWSYGGSWGFNVNGSKVPWREYLDQNPEGS